MVLNRQIIIILAVLCLLALHCGSVESLTANKDGKRTAAASSLVTNAPEAAPTQQEELLDQNQPKEEEVKDQGKQGTTLWKSWYHRATHLLDSMPSSSHLDEEAQRKVDEITHQITRLSKQLLKEERKLEALIIAQNMLKSGWTWFLDPQMRTAVEETNLKVNAQRRVVETVFDDITFLWRQLKPYYGIFSKMFLSELAIFLVMPFVTFVEFFAYVFSFGLLLFLLVLGPPAFFLSMFALSMGAALLPFLAGALLISWLIEFPSLILQYNPTFPEFVVAYAPFVLATVAVGMFVGKALGGPEVRRRGRTHDKTE